MDAHKAVSRKRTEFAHCDGKQDKHEKMKGFVLLLQFAWALRSLIIKIAICMLESRRSHSFEDRIAGSANG